MLYSGEASNGEVTVIGSTLVVKQNFTSAVPLPQTCDSRKHLKIPNWGHFTKYLPVPTTVKVIKTGEVWETVTDNRG